MAFDKKLFNIYFVILFSFIPVSILIGPAISLGNILLITMSFLFFFLNKKSFFLIKNQTLILIILLYLYLIFNSLVSIDIEKGAMRNLGFIRLIILFIAINYFFSNHKNLDNVFNIWTLVISIVLFDVIYEFYAGHNILGFASENKKRIVSFFKDEEVVGAFLNGFIFILIGYFFKNYEKKKNFEKLLIYLFIILIVISVIFTGERSNTLKLFIGLSIFFYFNNKIKLNYKIFFLISVITLFLVTFSQVNEIRHRYYNDLIQKLSNKENRQNYIYFKLYGSGLEVFKKYPFFGVGNKNYRTETCTHLNKKNEKYLCITHPHQIYLEFLSEHGLFGSIILLTILFYLIFKNFKIMLIKRNLVQIGCFSYLLTHFIPLLPGGSFFSDFNLTFFWLNFSLFYASNPETNIYKKINDLN